jgi:hypothetical protein
MALALAIGMYDRAAIHKFAEMAAHHAGRIQKGSRAGDTCVTIAVEEQPLNPEKRQYKVRLTTSRAENVCRVLYPYLSHTSKGKQMREAFARAGLTLI